MFQKQKDSKIFAILLDCSKNPHGNSHGTFFLYSTYLFFDFFIKEDNFNECKYAVCNHTDP